MKTKLFILFISLLSTSLCPALTTEKDEVVYVTKSGTKYHKEGCSYLRGGGIEKKLSEVENNYSPCSRCFNAKSNDSAPKQQNFSDSNTETDKSSNMGVETEKTKSGATIYTGPRGGRYHFSKSGKKVYEKK
ncbi:MAG: hypothetical protein RL641_263 [Candidatus Parcubacteria bacterium]|jgi:hypothetical protein